MTCSRSSSDWRVSPAFTDAERAALEYTERFMLDSPGIDAALFERLHAHFSDAEIVLLTAAIAKYMAWGRFVQVLDLEQQSCSVAPARLDPARRAVGRAPSRRSGRRRRAARAPVIQADSSLARNSARFATSSGSPSRPSGTSRPRSRSISSTSPPRCSYASSTSGVTTVAGQSAFMRMP